MPRSKHRPTDPSHEGQAERLQKLLARAGFGSRRSCESLISAGRVSVDGEIVSELGSKADPAAAQIAVDGVPIHFERLVYYLLFKPVGFLCTNADELGRTERAVDLVPAPGLRLFTVGRLDKESEGLVLVTNDGRLANRLTHPRFHIAKTYHVVVRGSLSQKSLDRLEAGVWLAEGKTRPSLVKVKKRTKKSTQLLITLTEGKNRQVRRVLAALGHPVSRLTRTAIGPLSLGPLRPGKSRKLAPEEVEALYRATQRNTAGRRARRATGKRAPDARASGSPAKAERPAGARSPRKPAQRKREGANGRGRSDAASKRQKRMKRRGTSHPEAAREAPPRKAPSAPPRRNKKDDFIG